MNESAELVLSWGIWSVLVLGLVLLLLRGLFSKEGRGYTFVMMSAALLPSLIVLSHRLLGLKQALGVHREVAKQYQEDLRRYIYAHSRGEQPFVFNSMLDDSSLENYGRTLQHALAATFLAVPFLLTMLLVATLPPDLASSSGFRALQLSGSGIFIYTLVLVIFRIRATAISAEFLLAAALRALIILVLGYVLGTTQVLQPDSSTLSPLLYLSIGLFPTLGMEVLTERMRKALKPSMPANDNLPLEYVDGINAQVAERLAELGISDIQHLARVEPDRLSLYTLYPLSRIIDWMDQAILISYLRDKIIFARQVGIRGAIDLSILYQDAVSALALPEPSLENVGAGPSLSTLLDPSQRARAMFQELGSRSSLGPQSIYSIGAILQEDYLVDLLASLRNRSHCPEKRCHGPLPPLEEAVRLEKSVTG